MTNIENLLNQKDAELERKNPSLMELEPVLVCEVQHIYPNTKVPEELKEIQEYWKEEADFYGDKGSCVLGAGFEFNYKGQRYFMPPTTMWQGSLSWEHCKDEIKEMLISAGATDVHYDYGNMD